MSKIDGYNPSQHGTSLSLLRKAIEAQLPLLTEPQLKDVLREITNHISGPPKFEATHHQTFPDIDSDHVDARHKR